MHGGVFKRRTPEKSDLYRIAYQQNMFRDFGKGAAIFRAKWPYFDHFAGESQEANPHGLHESILTEIRGKFAAINCN